MFVVALRLLLFLFLFHLIVVEKDDQYDYHKACGYICQHTIAKCPKTDKKKEWKKGKKKKSITYLSQEIHSLNERKRNRQIQFYFSILLLSKVYDWGIWSIENSVNENIVGHFYLSRCNVTLEMISKSIYVYQCARTISLNHVKLNERIYTLTDFDRVQHA